MIIVASSSKPFTYNAKGFPRRTPVLRDYEGEIEALYAAVEQSSQSDIPAPSSWDSDGVKAFVEATVHHILGKSLPADADIFRNGCDRWVPSYKSRSATILNPTLLQSASNVHSQHRLTCVAGALASRS